MNRSRLPAKIVKIAAALISLASLIAVLGLVAVPPMLGLREAVVLSDNMQPAVPKGGLALVEPLSGRVPHAGEIITFQRPDGDHSAVSRRVFVVTDHLGGPTIWTKADGAAAPDPWALRPDEVTGRVRYTIPYAGAITRWLHTPAGLVLAVGVPLGLALLYVVSLRTDQLRDQYRTQTLVESRLRDAYRS